MASTSSRVACARGRPPGSAPGIIGSNSAHSASERSDGYGRRAMAGLPKCGKLVSVHSLHASQTPSKLVCTYLDHIRLGLKSKATPHPEGTRCFQHYARDPQSAAARIRTFAYPLSSSRGRPRAGDAATGHDHPGFDAATAPELCRDRAQSRIAPRPPQSLTVGIRAGSYAQAGSASR